MRNILDGLFDKNLLEIFVKSISSIFVRILGLIFGVLLSIYIGNSFGAESVGIFSISVKILEFLTIIGMLGIGEVLMKEISINNSRGDNERLNRYIKSGLFLILIFSFVLLTLLYFLVEIISVKIFNNPLLIDYLKIFIIIAFFKIIISSISQVLKGLKYTWQANAFRDSISIALLIIIGSILIKLNYSLNLILICKIYLLCHLITLVISILFSVNKFKWETTHNLFKYNFLYKLLKESSPLLIVTSFVLINSFIDVFMLTSMGSLEEVGLYSVASRLGFLINFLLIMSGSIIAPKIAQFYAEKDINQLKKTVFYSSSAFFVFGVILLLFYSFFGNWLLSLWGEEFSVAYPLLLILSGGYFVNLIFGLSTFLLSMTGFQSVLGRISIGFGIFNIIMNYFFIKNYGAVGAALATAMTFTLESLVKVYFVKKYTNILLLPFKK